MASRLSKTGFAYHLTAYLAITCILLWINFDTTPDTLWAIWPIAGWGIGVVFHGLSVVLSSGVNKGIVYHFAAFAMVNALLIYINLTFSPGYVWFKFPLIAWTFMILLHGFIVFSKPDKAKRDR